MVCALFASVVACVAQEKQISRDEYIAASRNAYTKARGLNRRNVTKIQTFTDGKLTWDEQWQYEYDLPDNIHYVHVVSTNGKTIRTEEVDIAKTRYCKRDDAPWQPVTSSCIGGGTGGSPMNDTTKYSVEKVKLDGKDVSLYRQNTSYKDNYSKTKDTEGLSFSELKMWINKDGLMVRQEQTSGLIDPKTVRHSTIDTYEYDPKIKVEAPIK